jgi:hypothetical protein
MTTTTITAPRKLDVVKLLAVDAALLLVAAVVAAVLGAGVAAIVLAVLGVDLAVAAEVVARRRNRA